MIVVENAIAEVVRQMPPILGFQPQFHWGGQNELNRYIALKKQPYPLVWGIPQRETHDVNNKYVFSDIKLFIATRENKLDRLNDVRLTEMFAKVLFPLANYLIEGFKKSNAISLGDSDIEIMKLPNFSEQDKNKTIDYWDALEFTTSVRVSNNCEKPIKYTEL